MAKDNPDAVRTAVMLSKFAHSQLVGLTNAFSLSQSEVLEVLLANSDNTNIADRLHEARNAKVAGRSGVRKLIEKLAALSPAELASLGYKLEKLEPGTRPGPQNTLS